MVGRLRARLEALERRRAEAAQRPAPTGPPLPPGFWDALADGSAATDPAWSHLFTPSEIFDVVEERVARELANRQG